MFLVSPKNEALFDMEEQHQRCVRLLRENRQLLEAAELRIKLAQFNCRKNLDPRHMEQLLAILDGNCRQWVGHWTDRKDLLFLFCQIDDVLRECRRQAELSPYR